MEIKKINIVGMGALGILFGQLFTENLGKHCVEFVANEDRIQRYNKEGIVCNNTLCDFSIVSEDEKNKPADLLIFAVKATGLEEAIRSARNKVGKDTIIISLLNGISSEDIIGEAFGMDKVIYCVAQGMDAVKIGNELTYSKPGKLCIGITDNTENNKEKLERLVQLFKQANIPHTVESDIKHRIWSKFMLNVGVNQTVMIYEGTYDTIQQPGEARELMKSAMREVILIAQKENVNVTEKDLDEYVNLVDTLSPTGMPSMRQDGLARRKSEVELFSGTLLYLGKKHGIGTPVNEKIYRLVKQIEDKY